ncbi:hypothetical protein KY331_05755 [Candidatus Woesearchaeota archaeon]|nr:hypothetical protein [Candidatus Woesearchaeota archaeon]
MAKDQSKLVAILSYITLIGWIIALILNMSKKTELGSFHIRQALLLIIANIVLWWIPVIGWILQIVVLIFWIMGLVYAIQGQMKEVPVIGSYAQKWFKGL